MSMEPIKILLIEDNPSDVQLLRIILSEAKTTAFRLTAVDHLEAGLNILDKEIIDVILLDLSLPDAWGLETIQKMLHHTSEIPIVVLSGTNDESLAIKAVQMGAQDYLAKGEVTNQILIRTLRHAIERQRLVIDLEHQMAAYLNSEARWHNMIEHNADGIVILAEDHLIRFVNPAAEEMFAQSSDELIGSPFNFALEIDTPSEIDILRSENTLPGVTAEMQVVMTTWDDKPAYLATLRDITERKRVKEELEQHRADLENLVQERTLRLKEALNDAMQAHDRIDAIIHSVGDGLVVTDLDYRVILSNPGGQEYV